MGIGNGNATETKFSSKMKPNSRCSSQWTKPNQTKGATTAKRRVDNMNLQHSLWKNTLHHGHVWTRKADWRCDNPNVHCIDTAKIQRNGKIIQWKDDPQPIRNKQPDKRQPRVDPQSCVFDEKHEKKNQCKLHWRTLCIKNAHSKLWLNPPTVKL